MNFEKKTPISETLDGGESSSSQPLMRVESDHHQELREHDVPTTGRVSTGSEVVMLDEHIRQVLSSAPQPTVANVTQSTRVHIGPKFDFITQNVTNTEVVKGRILGLELISPQNTNRLRCSIAVFVCWALVVACALSFFIFHFAWSKKEDRLKLDLNETWYLRREDWLALPEYKLDLLDLPLRYVLIGHSALKNCTEKYSCIKEVLDIQTDHLKRGWNDIAPNFLVGGDSSVFEGRGANILGAMVYAWNRLGISFMFLGDYRYTQTTKEQYERIQIVIDELVRKKVLVTDYIVYGQCQVKGGIITPGPNIIDTLHNLQHWDSANVTSCVRK